METTFSWLMLALALGGLHALDADHIVTVSALATQKSGLKAAIVYASRWAIGHAVALMAIGLPVLLLGMAIPKTLSQASETVVGLAHWWENGSGALRTNLPLSQLAFGPKKTGALQIFFGINARYVWSSNKDDQNFPAALQSAKLFE